MLRLHETGWKMLRPVWSHLARWTELTIFRPGRIQSGMNVNTNSQIRFRPVSVALSASEQCMLDKALWKNNNNGMQENKSNDLWFSYRSHENMLTITKYITLIPSYLPVRLIDKHTFRRNSKNVPIALRPTLWSHKEAFAMDWDLSVDLVIWLFRRLSDECHE